MRDIEAIRLAVTGTDLPRGKRLSVFAAASPALVAAALKALR